MTEVISVAEAKARGMKRYFTGRPCRNGHLSERLISRDVCCECQKIAWKRYRAKNPDKDRLWQNTTKRRRLSNPVERAKAILRNKEWRRHNPRLRMLYAAKGRAKKLGIKFSITVDDIVLVEKCPVFGVTLQYEQAMGSQVLPHTASLDRIRNDEGYVPGNVAVISYKANILKKNGTLEIFEAIVRYMKNS